MVWYDFVILAILIFTTWSGLQRGLINQLAWIAAIVLCFKFADRLAPALEPHLIQIEDPSVRHGAAMLILYVGFSLGSFMLARVIDSWMEKAKLKDFDRHMGGLLGFVKGIVIALVVTYFAVTVGPTKDAVLQSQTGNYACYLVDKIEPITPAYFHDYLERLQHNLGHEEHEHLGEATTGFGDLFSEAEQGGSDLNDFAGHPGSETGLPSAPEWTAERGPSFEQLLEALPSEWRQQAEAHLRDKWVTSTAAERRALIDDVGRAFKTQVPDILSRFLGSKPVERGSAPIAGDAGQGSVEEGLAAIQAIYERGRFSGASTIARRGREFLAGVPTSVQRLVVQDWYADMSGRGPDPDPETDDLTPLDRRIIRQLDKAGVSLRSLDSSLRERLALSL